MRLLSLLRTSCDSPSTRYTPFSVLFSADFQSMEQDHSSVTKITRKRKAPDEENGFPLDELNEDLLERVLSWLPTSSFFRFRSVCKRWSSVASSATFKRACSGIASRDPWLIMVDPHMDRSIVFDTTEMNWKNLNYPNFLQQKQSSNSIPVASAGGVVCFRTDSGDSVICNPVTGACRELPPADPAVRTQTVHAIAMHSSSKYPSVYKLVLVSGEFPYLASRVYDSSKNQWEDEFTLSKKTDSVPESESAGDETVYFLNKAGDVVATSMQRTPSKQYSSVITVKGGEEIIYFLSHSGTVVACNLARRCFSEYPRLLPVFFEYSIDVVECRGEMLVVVLSEFLESASLRIWKFSEEDRSWHQIAAMPPSMSHEFYGKKADINCVGSGDQMLICVNSGEFSIYVLCNLVTNEWVELPKCAINGKANEFMSAFSFEPRVEACV